MNKSDEYGEMMSGECDGFQIDLCEELTGKECPVHNYNKCPGYKEGSIMEIPKDRMHNCEYHGYFPKTDVEIIDDGLRMCPICYKYEMETRKNCSIYPQCPLERLGHQPYSMKVPCEECEEQKDIDAMDKCGTCGDPVSPGHPMCDRCYWIIREG